MACGIFHGTTREHCITGIYQQDTISTFSETNFRVRTGPGKPGKSWNFVMAFSRTGKSWKKATGPGKSWKSV